MKYLSLFFLVLLYSLSTWAQGVMEINQPHIELKNLKADDQPTTVVYKIKNTGNQPLILLRVTPLSSQLKAEWNKQPIAPGQSEDLRISFTTANLQDYFNFRIMLYSNARNSRAEVELSGNLVDNPDKPELLYRYDMDGIKFKNNNVALNTVYTWQTVSDTAYFINTRKDSVKLSVQYQPNHINTQIIPACVAPGEKGMVVITFNAPQKNDYGYCYETLVFSFNNVRDYRHRLTVTAKLSEDFSRLNQKQLSEAPVATFDKKECNFGEIAPGEKATCDFTLTNTGKSVLFIRKTKASCGCTAVTLGENSLAPGKSTVIRATFDSRGKSGRQYKTITVITNDPKTPESLLNITGNIK